MNGFCENKLISVDMYPGQNVPEMDPHWWAAAMKKMGRLVRWASVSAVSQVAYQMTACEPIGSWTAPRSLGRGPLAWSEVRVVRAMMAESVMFFMWLLTESGGESYGGMCYLLWWGSVSSSFCSVSGQLFGVVDVSRMWNWCPMVVGWVRVWNWRMSLKFCGLKFSSSDRSHFLAWVVR